VGKEGGDKIREGINRKNEKGWRMKIRKELFSVEI
jgi:hypothetical protein